MIQTSRLSESDRLTYIFTLRLWQEGLGDGQVEWRGRIEHPPSGEVLYFREGSPIVPLLVRLISVSGEVSEIRVQEEDLEPGQC